MIFNVQMGAQDMKPRIFTMFFVVAVVITVTALIVGWAYMRPRSSLDGGALLLLSFFTSAQLALSHIKKPTGIKQIVPGRYTPKATFLQSSRHHVLLNNHLK